MAKVERRDVPGSSRRAFLGGIMRCADTATGEEKAMQLHRAKRVEQSSFFEYSAGDVDNPDAIERALAGCAGRDLVERRTGIWF
jgi:hypothetical protein